MFDNPDVATVEVVVRGPWAVGVAVSERARCASDHARHRQPRGL